MTITNPVIYLILKHSHGNDTKKHDTIKNDSKKIGFHENIKKAPDPSPKTMKKNLSTDNFMKFQWSWTL
tara:strand:- start:84 stop:290 length:207 start_codon:yes stop_codon:yes gene_type:complete